MGTSKNRPLPPERGRRRFEAWRSQRKPQSRIPQSLWKLAVRLARVHGLGRTATVLRLDYYTLKARVEADAAQAHAAAASFVELAPPVFLGKHCHVELINGAGATMRLQRTVRLVAVGRRGLAGTGCASTGGPDGRGRSDADRSGGGLETSDAWM